MVDSKKNEWQFRAQTRAAFGGDGFGLMSYEEEVGLWLNLEIPWTRMAVAVTKGIQYALGGGDLPREVFEAIALVPEQVDDLEYETNAARKTAELLAEFKAGNLQ
jgi:hypothetical protein